MRNAYSNLLGEFVEAKDVAHGDTAPFQIVCPCCSESIFKVVRPHEERESHYFSHRQADKSLVAECERRVGAMPAAEMERRNVESRGQTLKLFFSVLRDAIDLDFGHGGSPSGWHSSLQRAPSYNVVQTFLLPPKREDTSMRWQEEAYENFIARLHGNGLKLGQGLSQHFQKRVSFDLMRTLLTSQQSRSYGHLFRHALSLVLAKSYPDGSGGEIVGKDFVTQLLRSAGKRSASAAKQSLAEFRDRPLNVWGNEEDFIRSVVRMEMIGTLMRLPYREILANHRAGNALLHGMSRIEGGLGFGLEEGFTPRP